MTLLVWPLVPASDANDGQHNEYLLKSAFIERFTRFVHWPAPFSKDTQDKAFVIGALCEPSFCDILQQVFAHHRIKNRPVRIRLVRHPDELAGCHLVYIGRTDDTTLAGFLSCLRSKPVLTVSDTRGYAGKGVHINMFVENDQIRFEINHKSAMASGLKISHLLLQLARIVDNDNNGKG